MGEYLLCAGWMGICCVQGRCAFAVCRVGVYLLCAG